MKKLSLLLVFILVIMVVQGCRADANVQDNTQALEDKISEQEQRIAELETINEGLQQDLLQLQEQAGGQNEEHFLSRALYVVNLLDAKNIDALVSVIHPEKGVRFSPYAFIDNEDNIVFLPDEIRGVFESEETFTWGFFDGTGDPIEMTFREYYDRFIYDVDFAEPEVIGNNVSLSTGNTINNIEEIYPDERYVEFHFSGFDEQYVGLDWRSLRIVFEEYQGTWYVIGIVHDEWTI